VSYVLVGSWFAAVVAIAFAKEYLAGLILVAMIIVGVWDERRSQLQRDARTVHRQLLDELRRHD
jgi:hypothetical protein